MRKFVTVDQEYVVRWTKWGTWDAKGDGEADGTTPAAGCNAARWSFEQAFYVHVMCAQNRKTHYTVVNVEIDGPQHVRQGATGWDHTELEDALNATFEDLIGKKWLPQYLPAAA